MNKIIVLSIAIMALVSCKKAPAPIKKQTKNYPEVFSKIFNKHGGIDKWNELNQLSFVKGKETHTIDLRTRKSLIESENYSLGFDGKNVWLTAKDSLSFKGNKDFYYNLYFYFYAMPFVLADDGIIYEKSKPLVFENKSYPGIKISYKANIGSSPDDNYYMYYNPDTFQMEWLQYSVTFFSKKTSSKLNTIRYNDWLNVDDLLLPNSLTWYKKDTNGNITVPDRAPVKFSNQTISKQKASVSIFYESKE